MLTDHERAHRRRAIQALVATAVGIAMTVTLTTGLVSDPTSPSIPTRLGFVTD